MWREFKKWAFEGVRADICIICISEVHKTNAPGESTTPLSHSRLRAVLEGDAPSCTTWLPRVPAVVWANSLGSCWHPRAWIRSKPCCRWRGGGRRSCRSCRRWWAASGTAACRGSCLGSREASLQLLDQPMKSYSWANITRGTHCTSWWIKELKACPILYTCFLWPAHVPSWCHMENYPTSFIWFSDTKCLDRRWLIKLIFYASFLDNIITSAKEIMFSPLCCLFAPRSVCLFVSRITQKLQIKCSRKFGGRMRTGPRRNPCNFGTDLDKGVGFLSWNLSLCLHCEIMPFWDFDEKINEKRHI